MMSLQHEYVEPLKCLLSSSSCFETKGKEDDDDKGGRGLLKVNIFLGTRATLEIEIKQPSCLSRSGKLSSLMVNCNDDSKIVLFCLTASIPP